MIVTLKATRVAMIISSAATDTAKRRLAGRETLNAVHVEGAELPHAANVAQANARPMTFFRMSPRARR
jgi:hypothetical protein